MVIDELDNAIESLREARRAAGAGTAMRIDTLIAEVEKVKSDTQSIQNDGD